ncbi:LysR family transcriptional regulator [Paludibacterium yongneupense]|nr:LysR family transcriptional regulator [Paludibacterium yongneupense]
MQTFIRIVEAGNLSAAAQQLGTTQPTVSRRLQTLERTLGLRLLQRSTHTMTLTEAGARYYEQARAFIDEWGAFESDLRGAIDEPEGLLRVVVPHAFGQQHLLAPLAQFLRRYPALSVEWQLTDSAPNLVEQGLDCQIRVGEGVDPALVAIKLADVPRVMVASPSLLQGVPAPTSPAALAALPWLAFSTYYRNEIELRDASGATQTLTLRPRLYTDSVYALRNAAMQGLGVAVVSGWLVEDDVARGDLIHVLPGWRAAPLPVYLLYPYARFYPAKLRRFIDAMRDSMREPLWPTG